MKTSQVTKEKIEERVYGTKMKTIERKHGVDFGLDGEMELGAFLKKQGYAPLADMLEEA